MERAPKRQTTDQKFENCVLSALGKYLKADVVTQLKGIAARAGLAVGVLLGGALSEIALAEAAEGGWGLLTGLHTFGESLLFRGLSYVSGVEVVRNTIEQIKNRKDLLSDIKACYSSL